MILQKYIIPAIIGKNQQELDERIKIVMDHVDIIQLDFMDNIFVPNTSLIFDFTLPETKCKFEAHLMVQEPLDWINKYGDKVDTILVHFESNFKPDIIEIVKQKNKKFGFVLNPETSIEKLKPYINDIDQVLIMTVNPGFYGSPFLPDTLDKIKALREMKNDLDIEVDGGITDKTIALVDTAGANMFVSGSYIVKSENVVKAIDNLKNKIHS
jgi:ribulose-phosphate 3-epimerase